MCFQVEISDCVIFKTEVETQSSNDFTEFYIKCELLFREANENDIKNPKNI